VVDVAAADLLEGVDNTERILEEHKILLARPPEPGMPSGVVSKPTLLVCNKGDLPGAEENLDALRELLGNRFPTVLVSAETGHDLDQFRRAVFDLLNVVRVYTKAPGKKPDMTAPFVLRRGATVLNVAEHVHKDFAAQMKFARLWGAGKFEGQMVQRDYVVADSDVIEFHI
jgi:uncharacterized protein